MRIIKTKCLVLALLASISLPLFAVVEIYEQAVADFAQNINVKAYDRYTGEFYVGTDTANGDYTIAKAGRDATVFTGLSTAGGVQAALTAMAIMNNAGVAATHIAVRENATGTMPVIPIAGGAVVDTAALGAAAVDTTNICDAAGAAANSFTLLEGGYYSVLEYGLFFLRVMANAAADGPNSGILAFKLTDGGTPLVRVGTVGLNNPATRVDGNKSDDNFLRAASASDPLATNPVVNDLYWDPTLNTLFVAGSVTTAVAADFHSAILKVTVAGGNLATNAVLPAGVNAYDSGVAQDSEAIFATDSTTALNHPRILKIRTMHTSTDKTYLIVNGGVGAADANVGNQFYALRYDVTDGHVVQNDVTRAEVGSTALTRGTALLDDFKRSGGAAVGQSLDGGNVGSLLIGGADAPWDEANAATDMEVVGDTVYVSLATARGAANDPGVWASTAMFNKDGVVIGWTSWERVMPSDGQTNRQDLVSFFAVDGVNGKVWTVDGTTAGAPVTVSRSAWATTGFTANTLPATINTSFAANTYSDVTCALDIPMNTPGVTHVHTAADSLTSLTMVGGYEKVDFAKTSIIAAANANAIGQKSTMDFSVANMYVETTLDGAGTVRCLGASRSVAASQGYFLAGTDSGLWIWALDAGTHAGYDASTAIDATAAAPFDSTTASWYQFDTTKISGPVTAIDSDGIYIYLIEQDVSSAAGTIVSKLWRIAIGDNITEMEVAGQAVVIAQSGKDEIPANAIFTDFKFITDGDGARGQRDPVGSENKCLLSTDHGLYYPSQTLRNYTDVTGDDATPNAPNAWYAKHVDEVFPSGSLFAPKRVPATAVLAGTNDGVNHKVIASGLVDDTRGLGYYQNTELRQVNADSAIVFPYLDTTAYTNASMATGTTALTYLNNRALSFWTDGGRRLYTRRNVAASWGNSSTFEMLQSLPYNANEWNMTQPYGDDGLQGQTIYWIESISGNGTILAGTPSGVIALQ